MVLHTQPTSPLVSSSDGSGRGGMNISGLDDDVMSHVKPPPADTGFPKKARFPKFKNISDLLSDDKEGKIM